ncbi:MAG: hypothetical protein ABSE86_22775 [Bryobacteraceae bacterium]|jgi:hypothetical protein
MTRLMEDTKIDNNRDRLTRTVTDANATTRKNRWLPYDMDEQSLDIDNNAQDDADDISLAHWNV